MKELIIVLGNINVNKLINFAIVIGIMLYAVGANTFITKGLNLPIRIIQKRVW